MVMTALVTVPMVNSSGTVVLACCLGQVQCPHMPVLSVFNVFEPVQSMHLPLKRLNGAQLDAVRINYEFNCASTGKHMDCFTYKICFIANYR
jgi:hypothetical protein